MSIGPEARPAAVHRLLSGAHDRVIDHRTVEESRAYMLELEKTRDELTEDNGRLQQQIEWQGSTINQLKARIGTLTSEIASQRDMIAQLKRRIESLGGDL